MDRDFGALSEPLGAFLGASRELLGQSSCFGFLEVVLYNLLGSLRVDFDLQS